MKIGFIGLGNMGMPMARNLIAEGHEVTGFDLIQKSDPLVQISKLLSETVSGKEVIITMLPDGSSLLEVYSSILNELQSEAILIDCSTVDVISAKKAAGMANEKGLKALDAPVSGGIGGAENGTLTFMVGGDIAAFERVTPLFNIMGQKAVLCGESGAGQSVKICNNMILGVSMIAVCEAFVMADNLGLDRSKMFDVVSTASGSCWAINTYCPVPNVGPNTPADNNYIPGFSADLMLKDLGLAKTAAEETNSFTPLGKEAYALYENFFSKGGKGKDFSAILNFIKDS
ncbi:MAG: 3-hydroxyisobutyrate dehydrogenase [Paracoccaceae bacterium]|jgi:3-hydroxyisobutyrate dehydrogenase|nr:MAG: 3-hydroxyisobutyrate dehydrogenase [Paracoccaceae bacterium]|tara:strand:- start:201 stop:1061 length:861 start_codon:yes stop_codon:yes gene_type:complete